MQFDEFTGEVQHRLELGTEGKAVRATRAVLQTLGERIGEGEATDLAGPLPMEIDRYLTEAPDHHAEQFGFQVFVQRVSNRANVEESEALYYAQSVVHLVAETTQADEIEQVQEQLPDEFEDLFEFVEVEAPTW